MGVDLLRPRLTRASHCLHHVKSTVSRAGLGDVVVVAIVNVRPRSYYLLNYTQFSQAYTLNDPQFSRTRTFTDYKH